MCQFCIYLHSFKTSFLICALSHTSSTNTYSNLQQITVNILTYCFISYSHGSGTSLKLCPLCGLCKYFPHSFLCLAGGSTEAKLISQGVAEWTRTTHVLETKTELYNTNWPNHHAGPLAAISTKC